MFTLLLKTYIYYGTQVTPQYIQNKLWYKTVEAKTRDLLRHDYRWFYVTEPDLGYAFSYIVRNESPELFEAKWSILRFNKWIIFNIHWFQPDKMRNKRSRKTKTVGRLLVSHPTEPLNSKHVKLYKRLTLLTRLGLNNATSKKPTYVF